MPIGLEDDEDLGPIEIEVEDDTPPEDQGRPKAPEVSEDDPPAEGETAEQYSARVKKRIDKETAKFHAERRAKEQLIRERDEAIAFARNAVSQVETLKNQNSTFEQGFVHQARQTAEAISEKAAKDYQDAMANGDTAAMLDAQKRLTRAEMDKAKYEGYVPQEPVQPQPQPQIQAQPKRADVSPEALELQTEYLKNNPWFFKDQEMQRRALEIDAHIRNTAPAAVGTKAYYDYVDTILKQEFPPERFGTKGEQGAGVAPATRATQAGVAPVNRGSGTSPRKVTLTATQVGICKKLGITPEQYAAQLLKRAN